MVEGVHCLFVAKGVRRVAAIRIQFAGGNHRDYLLVHKPATGGSVGDRPRRTVVRSFADAGTDTGLDLRKTRDAAALAKLLEKSDLENLTIPR
jgi:hypothetical protein